MEMYDRRIVQPTDMHNLEIKIDRHKGALLFNTNVATTEKEYVPSEFTITC